MRFYSAILFFMLFSTQSLWAKFVAVLETTSDQSTTEYISLEERRYLTDVLRSQAVKYLPAEQNFTIMTRENINVMLPPGKSIEDCEGSCLAETGRNIAADYVAQARVTLVGGILAISAEMYETAGSKLISSFNGKGSDVHAVEQLILKNSPEFFKAVKSKAAGWGIGEVDVGGAFEFDAIQQNIVEIITEPAGALPTVDGKGIPKCTNTPCKVLLEAGEHRFVVSKEHYEVAETLVDIKSNNQQVKIVLEPNFGYINVKPILKTNVGNEKDLTVLLDNQKVNLGTLVVDQGVHSIAINHPCYDPALFKVMVKKNETETIEKELVHGAGGLELNVVRHNEPLEVYVYADGHVLGKTPFSGVVPLCSRISVGDVSHIEEVKVALKWHDVVKHTHEMGDPPVVLPQSAAEIAFVFDTTETALSADPMSPQDGFSNKKFRTGLRIISGVVTAAGIIVAMVGETMAHDAREKGFSTTSEYRENKDAAQKGQNLRTAGIIPAIVGAIGLGISFLF